MAQFTRLELVQIMKDTGMVPLFYNKDTEISKKVITACYRGGARLLEFTARGDFAHEVFGELVKYATKELPWGFKNTHDSYKQVAWNITHNNECPWQ